jgi:hypothetical protein
LANGKNFALLLFCWLDPNSTLVLNRIQHLNNMSTI